jgi:hypothetical protein
VTIEMIKNNNDNMTGNGNYLTETMLIREIEKYNSSDGIANRNFIQTYMNISKTFSEYTNVIRNFLYC